MREFDPRPYKDQRGKMVRPYLVREHQVIDTFVTVYAANKKEAEELASSGTYACRQWPCNHTQKDYEAFDYRPVE